MKMEVRDGEFGYTKDRLILKDVNFSINEGEILTILGPNGVGKTTLLKCTTSLFQWKKGATYIDEIALSSLGRNQVWKDMGYVPQSSRGAFAYRVFDMVLMGRSPHLNLFSLPTKKDKDIALSSLNMVGILDLKNRSCGEISGGEMQLVLIARALASQPRILILDEPESHLDLKNQMVILDVLKRVAKQEGISCLINTHYPDHALQIGDMTLMMGKESPAVFGKSDAVISEDNLKKYFDVDVKLISYDSDGKTMMTIVPQFNN